MWLGDGIAKHGMMRGAHAQRTEAETATVHGEETQREALAMARGDGRHAHVHHHAACSGFAMTKGSVL